MEHHRLPRKRLILGTGKQRGLGSEPHWEEAQQQGGSLMGKMIIDDDYDTVKLW